MKKKVFSLFFTLILSGSFTVLAQTKTEKFEVKGNCGMCKERIEKAAKSVDGVTAADWDKDTKLLSVTFDSNQTNSGEIQASIAKAGHDTGKYIASDEVYNNLPACCKYERTNRSVTPKYDKNSAKPCRSKGKSSCCDKK